MRRLFILAFIVLWPIGSRAGYFSGIDKLNHGDVAGAIQELASLAEAGEADAEDALGVAYDRSNYVSGTTRARELFRKAADNGLLLGMLNLAHSLQAGRGGPPNPAEAATWLTRAAQAGLPVAMVRLADAYRQGVGVPLDKTSAQTWYDRAAKLNDPAGMAGLADMMLESPESAVKAEGTNWLERASQRGNPHAQQELALAKLLGAGGVPKDEAGGVALARSAASHGDALGAVLLAEAYHDGRGLPASQTDSLHWYAEAARLGAIRGQVETARAKLGPGPAHDPAGAFFWLAVAGHHPGQLQATIDALNRAATHELTPLQQAEISTKADNWRPGMPP